MRGWLRKGGLGNLPGKVSMRTGQEPGQGTVGAKKGVGTGAGRVEAQAGGRGGLERARLRARHHHTRLILTAPRECMLLSA